jgi:hypothetical protein
MNQDSKQNRDVQAGVQQFVLLPAEAWQAMQANQARMLALLEHRATSAVDDYLSEKGVIRLLGRGPTWLWDKRKRGELEFTKVGNRVLYKHNDLLDYLDAHRVESFKKKHEHT